MISVESSRLCGTMQQGGIVGKEDCIVIDWTKQKADWNELQKETRTSIGIQKN